MQAQSWCKKLSWLEREAIPPQGCTPGPAPPLWHWFGTKLFFALNVQKHCLEEQPAMVELCPCAQSKIDRRLAKRFSVLFWPLGCSFMSFLEQLQIFLLAVLLSEPISVSWSCLLKALKLWSGGWRKTVLLSSWKTCIKAPVVNLQSIKNKQNLTVG